MSEDMKKISTEEILKAAENCASDEYRDMEWCGLTVRVKRNLSLAEMAGMVSSTVSACFDDESGKYVPEVEEFAIRANVISYYTNAELPEDFDAMYKFVYSEPGYQLYRGVSDIIDWTQFSDIRDAIYDTIEYMTDAKSAEILARIAEVVTSFEEFVDSMGSAFDGVDSGALMQMLRVLSSGGIDEEKLAKAVVENNVARAVPQDHKRKLKAIPKE